MDEPAKIFKNLLIDYKEESTIEVFELLFVLFDTTMWVKDNVYNSVDTYINHMNNFFLEETSDNLYNIVLNTFKYIIVLNTFKYIPEDVLENTRKSGIYIFILYIILIFYNNDDEISEDKLLSLLDTIDKDKILKYKNILYGYIIEKLPNKWDNDYVKKTNKVDMKNVFYLTLFINFFTNKSSKSDNNIVERIFTNFENKMKNSNIDLYGKIVKEIDKMPLFSDTNTKIKISYDDTNFNIPTINYYNDIKQYFDKSGLEIMLFFFNYIKRIYNKEICFIDSVLTEKEWFNTHKYFIYDAYIHGKSFLSHGRLSHIFHEIIIYDTIKKFIYDCSCHNIKLRKNISDDKQIYKKSINLLCDYICTYEDKDILYDTIIKFLYNNKYERLLLNITYEHEYLDNFETLLWGDLFDRLPQNSDINIITKNLSKFISSPDYIYYYGLVSKKHPFFYFISHLNHYITLKMIKYYYDNLFAKYKNITLSDFLNNEIDYNKEIQINSKIMNHITSTNNFTLKPDEEFHTRYVFKKIIEDMENNKEFLNNMKYITDGNYIIDGNIKIDISNQIKSILFRNNTYSIDDNKYKLTLLKNNERKTTYILDNGIEKIICHIIKDINYDDKTLYINQNYKYWIYNLNIIKEKNLDCEKLILSEIRNNMMYIFIEYIDGITLRDYINKLIPENNTEILNIMQQSKIPNHTKSVKIQDIIYTSKLYLDIEDKLHRVSNTIFRLSNYGIVHMDINIDNILVTGKKVYIIDFELSSNGEFMEGIFSKENYEYTQGSYTNISEKFSTLLAHFFKLRNELKDLGNYLNKMRVKLTKKTRDKSLKQYNELSEQIIYYFNNYNYNVFDEMKKDIFEFINNYHNKLLNNENEKNFLLYKNKYLKYKQKYLQLKNKYLIY
jgi:hypothetical protein